MVLRFHQLLCYMNIFRFSHNRVYFGGHIRTNARGGCICTAHQLAGYRWHHVPADGRYSQLCDNPWMCEAKIQACRLTTSLTRWQMTTHVLVPQSTVRLAVERQCESSKYTRNQRHEAPLEVRMSLPVSDEAVIGCDNNTRWQRKANLRSSFITEWLTSTVVQQCG